MRRPCSNGWNRPFRSNFGIRDITAAHVPAPFDPAETLPIIAGSRTTQLVLDSPCGIDARYH